MELYFTHGKHTRKFCTIPQYDNLFATRFIDLTFFLQFFPIFFAVNKIYRGKGAKQIAAGIEAGGQASASASASARELLERERGTDIDTESVDSRTIKYQAGSVGGSGSGSGGGGIVGGISGSVSDISVRNLGNNSTQDLDLGSELQIQTHSIPLSMSTVTIGASVSTMVRADTPSVPFSSVDDDSGDGGPDGGGDGMEFEGQKSSEFGYIGAASSSSTLESGSGSGSVEGVDECENEDEDGDEGGLEVEVDDDVDSDEFDRMDQNNVIVAVGERERGGEVMSESKDENEVEDEDEEEADGEEKEETDREGERGSERGIATLVETEPSSSSSMYVQSIMHSNVQAVEVRTQENVDDFEGGLQEGCIEGNMVIGSGEEEVRVSDEGLQSDMNGTTERAKRKYEDIIDIKNDEMKINRMTNNTKTNSYSMNDSVSLKK